MPTIFILAFALSMDAFAVSIALGAKHHHHRGLLACKAGIYFGVFQALMPLIGYAIGEGTATWLTSYTHWIAFILLLIIGCKMIYESFSSQADVLNKQTQKGTMLILVIATSLDAMAAGFSLPLLTPSIYTSCVIIGVVTFLMSFSGVFVGVAGLTCLENKAELIGGLVLILIGLKLILF